MWRGYECHGPALGMIFRKMYCHKCGQRLKREKVIVIYKKGDVGFTDDVNGEPVVGMTEKSVSSYIYKCPNCNATITYSKQREIAKIQKHQKKIILDENN